MEKVLIVDVNGATCVKDAPNVLTCAWIADNIGCDWVEIVRPKNLPRGIVMIVDEEGLMKENFINVAGSHLYGTEEHGEVIVGDIMIVREVFGPEGPELAGLLPETAKKLSEDLGDPLRRMDWEDAIRTRLGM